MKLPDRNHGIIKYFINDLSVNDIPAIEILLNLTTQSVIMFAYFLKNTLYRHQGQQGSLTCQQTPSKSQSGTVTLMVFVRLVIFISYKEKEAVAEAPVRMYQWSFIFSVLQALTEEEAVQFIKCVCSDVHH